MKKLLGILTIGLLFVGCADTEIERTGVLREKAVVVALIHSPSEHHTELTRTAYDHGTGITATDYNGNTGYKLNEHLQVTTTEITEKFGIAFQCQHGTFTVEGDQTKHMVLYNKLSQSVGDTVTVLYKEFYELTYEKVNGKRTLVNRSLYDIDFIDAQK